MITNEREYQITREWAEKFEEARDHYQKDDPKLHPLLNKAMHESFDSEVEILRAQMAEYEALQTARMVRLELDWLLDLPGALIQSRSAAGLTQKALAQRLGLREQQIQRYEATRYAGASLVRIQAVAAALGMIIHLRITMPTQAGRAGIAGAEDADSAEATTPPVRAGASPSAPGTRGRRRAAAPRSTRGR